MAVKRVEVTVFRFVRTQDTARKSGYYDAIPIPNFIPSEVAASVRDVHSILAEQMNRVPDTMYFTFPVTTSVGQYTLFGAASRVRERNSAGFVRLAAVAASTADLMDGDIDPMDVMAALDWRDSANWATAKFELTVKHDFTIDPDSKKSADMIGESKGAESPVEWSEYPIDGLFDIYSLVLRKKQAKARYACAVGIYVPTKLKFPVAFDYVVPAPARESAVKGKSKSVQVSGGIPASRTRKYDKEGPNSPPRRSKSMLIVLAIWLILLTASAAWTLYKHFNKRPMSKVHTVTTGMLGSPHVPAAVNTTGFLTHEADPAEERAARRAKRHADAEAAAAQRKQDAEMAAIQKQTDADVAAVEKRWAAQEAANKKKTEGGTAVMPHD